MNITVNDPTLEQKIANLLASGYEPDEILQAGVDIIGVQTKDTKGNSRTGISWNDFFDRIDALPEDFSVDRSDLYHNDNKVRF